MSDAQSAPTAVAVLTHIVKSIVDQPDAVTVDEVAGEGKHRLDVRVGDASVKQIPASVQQRLNLARAYLKRAPIMLFDAAAQAISRD